MREGIGCSTSRDPGRGQADRIMNEEKQKERICCPFGNQTESVHQHNRIRESSTDEKMTEYKSNREARQ